MQRMIATRFIEGWEKGRESRQEEIDKLKLEIKNKKPSDADDPFCDDEYNYG